MTVFSCWLGNSFSATSAFTYTKKMTDFNPAVTVLFEQKLTVCHFLSDRPIRIASFVGLTSLRRHLSAGVQFSSVLQRPKPSRCLSGCPGRRDGWIKSLCLNAGAILKMITGGRFLAFEEMSPVNLAFQQLKRTERLPEESSVGAPSGATPQKSSLWVGIYWRVPQKHSQRRARSYNTCFTNVERYLCEKQLPHIASQWQTDAPGGVFF